MSNGYKIKGRVIIPIIAKERYAYDPETGAVTYKIDLTRGRKAGTPAWTIKRGKDNEDDRLQINMLNRSPPMANLIWFLMTGKQVPEGFCIDHLDQNPMNNKWSNLRLSTKSQNARNRKLSSNNKTGVNGVYIAANGKYRAAYYINNRKYDVGTFHTLGEAEAASKSARDVTGAFTSRHGQIRLT